MRVLGVETSCDETAVAVYDGASGLLAHELYSQVELHAAYGGVVPELASREHIRKLLPLVEQALGAAGLRGADKEQISWDRVEKMLEDDRVIDSKITGFNKGGLIVAVEGLRGFVPALQISAMRRAQSSGDTPEQRWQKMIGQPISVRVIEVDRERRRLILSERAASSESRQSIKERVIDELEEGKVYTGRVTSLANFGAFVNINGAEAWCTFPNSPGIMWITPGKSSRSGRKLK